MNLQLGPAADVVVAEHGVKPHARCKQIGERLLEHLRDSPPDAVAVDVVAQHQREVELRPVAVIDPHLACDAQQAARDFAGVADDRKDERRLAHGGLVVDSQPRHTNDQHEDSPTERADHFEPRTLQNLNITPACTFTKTGSKSTGARPASRSSRISPLFSAPKRSS